MLPFIDHTEMWFTLVISNYYTAHYTSQYHRVVEEGFSSAKCGFTALASKMLKGFRRKTFRPNLAYGSLW